jgi:hypothetical protein
MQLTNLARPRLPSHSVHGGCQRLTMLSRGDHGGTDFGYGGTAPRYRLKKSSPRRWRRADVTARIETGNFLEWWISSQRMRVAGWAERQMSSHSQAAQHAWSWSHLNVVLEGVFARVIEYCYCLWSHYCARMNPGCDYRSILYYTIPYTHSITIPRSRTMCVFRKIEEPLSDRPTCGMVEQRLLCEAHVERP